MKCVRLLLLLHDCVVLFVADGSDILAHSDTVNSITE